MYFLNIFSAIKRITVKEIKGFIYENYYRWIGFLKENSYYLIKVKKEEDSLLLATKFIEKNTWCY